MVLGGYEGDDVDEGGGEDGACLLRWGGVAEEEGDGVRVGDVGCGCCVVDIEAEEGGDGGVGGGGIHGCLVGWGWREGWVRIVVILGIL